MSENPNEEDERPLTPDLEIGGVALDAKEGLMINRPIKRYTRSDMYMIRAALSPNKQRINDLLKPLQPDQQFSMQSNQHQKQSSTLFKEGKGKIWRPKRFRCGTGTVLMRR
ncbi:hypothetical protein E6O75_ATG00443 [Venturia nashicola]|uniref:Uncharacterized protein n=1 Tax=Venturia nashicola TaxID=86259 RepID=A0A4Z1PGE2_9PEZI|nr:hypothetical protein E6O75_ATG00443 [Venturia nashicola]